MNQKIVLAIVALACTFFVADVSWAGRARVRNCLPKTYTKNVTFRAYNLSGGLPTSTVKNVKYGKQRKLTCDARVKSHRCKVCATYRPNANTNMFKTCRSMTGEWRLVYKNKSATFAKGGKCN